MSYVTEPHPVTIVAVEVLPTRVTITYRRPSAAYFACNPPRPMPDTVWKAVYTLLNGELVFDRKVHGTHTPAELRPETIIFPE